MISANQPPGGERAKEASGDAAAGVGRSPGRHVWLVCIGLVIGTLAVYAQVREFQFVDWDDHRFFRENPYARSGLSWENFAWSLRIHGPGQWHPMAWWMHQLNCELFGLDAGGHHLVNALLHAVAALALLAAFWRLTGDFWPSALVAALFALHPLSVESVAWASHLRDPLSTIFWALVMWSYAAFARRGGARRYALVLVLFALGLMSKPTLITLPCVLLLLDYWPLRRIAWFEGAASSPVGAGTMIPPQTLRRVLLEKAPLIVLSGISAWLCFLCQYSEGSVKSLEAYPTGARLANAAQTYVLHLWKVAWPANLSNIYLYPTSFHPLAVAGAVMFLFLVTAAAVWFGRRRRHLLVGWLWFVGTLAPVIGLLKLGGPTSMTDHHGYVSRLGIYLAIAWALAELVERRPAVRRAVAVGVGAVLLVLMPLSWRQAGVWRDDISLNAHALAVTKNNYLVHLKMGYALHLLGRTQEAIAHYEEVLRISPGHPEALYNLGNQYSKQRRFEEAEASYRSALRVVPADVDLLTNFVAMLVGQERLVEAAALLEEAIALQPDLAGVHFLLGRVQYKQGKLPDARESFETVTRLDPGHSEACFQMGLIAFVNENYDEAGEYFIAALRINPDWPEAHNSLGVVFLKTSNIEKALEHFRRALQLDPNYRDAQTNIRVASKLLGGEEPVKDESK